MAGAVDHVHGVALGDEQPRPAGSAVGRGQVVGSLAAAAVDQPTHGGSAEGWAGASHSTYIGPRATVPNGPLTGSVPIQNDPRRELVSGPLGTWALTGGESIPRTRA